MCFYYDCKMKIFSLAKSSVMILFIAFIASCSFTDKAKGIIYVTDILNQFDTIQKLSKEMVTAIEENRFDDAEKTRENAVYAFYSIEVNLENSEGFKGNTQLKDQMMKSMTVYQKAFRKEISKIIELHKQYVETEEGSEEEKQIEEQIIRLNKEYSEINKREIAAIATAMKDFCDREGLKYTSDEDGNFNIKTK